MPTPTKGPRLGGGPAHERLIADIAKGRAPGLPVSCSADVVPEYREFERFSTTVLNAYLQPLLDEYLANLEERLLAAGYGHGVLTVGSSGGTGPVGGGGLPAPGGPTSAGRPVAAVTAINAQSFARYSMPIRANATTAPSDSGRISVDTRGDAETTGSTHSSRIASTTSPSFGSALSW